ncbi:uncharacterized protein [Fopius arisanus]|uniref:Pkc-2 protein n=1 Tax=Fopius arisanus TaxID=64838 RepID=A0A0C9QEI7_9HYME|nr:PREDICTED: uncharacterized protein LOC105272353 [Fopius arisanus]XP_011312753.1 PREDICTED: uncharacterized protein LOC105272353 [Fopius arisanus]XP_011312754.1 PREDICTED: uncharacterized protein LOC105272353 [Fopius arisanus]
MPDEREILSNLTSDCNHGHSMFRVVDRPFNFRQSASDWIYKMLFLWSREPSQSPRASPWFAWLAMAIVIWSCRRQILRAILTLSPLRLVKRRNTSHNCQFKKSTSREEITEEKISMILHPKHMTGVRARMKRICPGDGPHVSDDLHEIPQVQYRVTRSGRVYGKYPHKVVIPS